MTKCAARRWTELIVANERRPTYKQLEERVKNAGPMVHLLHPAKPLRLKIGDVKKK